MIAQLSTKQLQHHKISNKMQAATKTTPHTPPRTLFNTTTPQRLQSTTKCHAATPQSQQQNQPTTDTTQTTASTSKSYGDQYFTPNDSRPIILFDGVCNLCNGGVNFMLDWDTQGKCRFAALQSHAGKQLLQRSGRSPDDISSIVFVTQEGSYIKSEAILRIGQTLNMPLALLAGLALLVPLGFRDTFYDGVANNRYNMFGYADQCRLGDTRFEDRFIA